LEDAALADRGGEAGLRAEGLDEGLAAVREWASARLPGDVESLRVLK
jgi:hypothetical protein